MSDRSSAQSTPSSVGYEAAIMARNLEMQMLRQVQAMSDKAEDELLARDYLCGVVPMR